MSSNYLSGKELELLKSVFSKHSEISSVLLFGSRAKGTNRQDSDIDIAVCGISDKLSTEEIAVELDELPLPYKFDVKTFDNIRNVALREHITRVGIVIYQSDKS